MSDSDRFKTALKATRQLGLGQLGLYAVYRLGLRSGYFRLRTPSGGGGLEIESGSLNLQMFALPAREELAQVLGDQAGKLIAQADEVVEGQARIFGGEPRSLDLTPLGPLDHWTQVRYDAEALGEIQDVKWVWEMGRFGWAYTLGRAYHLTGDERYVKAFWEYTDAFLDANPPNLGLHWVSAQEVALRLMAFSFSAQVFARSPYSKPERMARLGEAVAAHAARIPPTLVYARAQNNNHLLTEAAGLYTAGLALPEHPSAGRWRALGWRWFNRALQSQIAEDGTYVQHSANYHRLMLQAALWVAQLAEHHNQPLPAGTRKKLEAATRWLLALLDEESGQVPNLGPNDGAYILPLTAAPFEDYRPVLQAACISFLGEPVFPPGPGEEMALWLGSQPSAFRPRPKGINLADLRKTYTVVPSPDGESWASLRAARFTSRPGHADQLHLDLWWRGLNLAQDAGTYLYNAPPPWDNALAGTAVHNTITLNGQDQMTPAGRFLWLDWARAEEIEEETPGEEGIAMLTAQHDGYRRLGVLHRRAVSADDQGHWLITDTLLPRNSQSATPESPFTARLHWLLPDWPWELEDTTLRVQSPHGWVSLKIEIEAETPPRVQLVRAGELLHGGGQAAPIQGWVSPTYGHKVPALSFSVEVENQIPLTMKSTWTFPE